MAQTKRKSKHRGNAAGMIEARGRTGRPLSAAERNKPLSKQQMREQRLDRPPNWKSAFRRALIAAVLMVLISFFLLRNAAGGKLTSLLLFPAVLVMYTVLGFYTDRWIWRRRMARKAKVAAS